MAEALADAKNRRSELVSAVQGTWERVTITKNGKPVAVLVAVEDLVSVTETLEVLSDPDAMAGIAEDRSGTGELTTGQEMAAIMAKRSGRGVRYGLRLSRAASRALAETLPKSVAAAVWEFVNGPLLDDPHRVGKPLRFELEGYHSARRGQYRVIYRISEREVIVDVTGGRT